MSARSKQHDSPLSRIRHSLAHVLAQAMQQYRPGTRLGFGPAIEDGFFYDFLLPEPIGEEDLPAIQTLMKAIIKANQPFEREELAPDAAYARLEEMGEPYKVEYCRELVAKQELDSISFYTNGPFVDMCEGPHVEATREIPHNAFKLTSVTGAYWRGDEKNAQMTRVYGWAFSDKKDLRAYEQARQEAEKRDHRKLGAKLDLFVIDEDVGKGLPLWLPNGAVLCDELEKLAREYEFADGYDRVRTPEITKGRLYDISGHLSLYKASMFPPMILEDEGEGGSESYYLKPMNCPHHHKIYCARQRSYRDLPLRLAEYGRTYRYERSGTLQGLTRVRGMCMNDAHIYITEEQIREEFISVMELHKRYYDLFGFSDYYMRLSLWDPEDPKGKEKYVDDPPAWEFSQARVREAMAEVGIPFEEVKGEAAFYGPKIDIQFKTVGLREFTVSTNQLDFAVPKRFNERGIKMVYKASDGTEKVPYVIHRAPLSTHERFVGFLIEHYGGAFPTWLAPIQVRVVPLTDQFVGYGDKIVERLRGHMIRAECDHSGERLGKLIKLGSEAKIPILLVVGENEQSEESVTVRRYGIQEQRTMKLAELEAQLLAEVQARRHVQTWDDVISPST